MVGDVGARQMNGTNIISAVLLIGLLQTTQAAVDSMPLIQYSWGGGLSNIKSADLRIHDTGKVLVKCVKQEQKPLEYEFTLDGDEVAALISLVQIVKFFDQPTNDTSFATDVGESSLTVSLGNNRRTLNYRFRPELDPLTQALWKLIQQGIVTAELQTNGDTYQAMVASSSRLVGSKVYCPRLLVDPLKKENARCQDRQKLEWGLTGLAWLVTEDQWLGFVSSQLTDARAGRKALLLGVLGSHPFYGNIPDTHAHILLPLLTSLLDSFTGTKGPIEPKTDESLGIVCQFIGSKKYDRSLPTLFKLRQVHGDSVAGGWAGWAIESITAEKKKPQPESGHVRK
jgi:hypothetical protein